MRTTFYHRVVKVGVKVIAVIVTLQSISRCIITRRVMAFFKLYFIDKKEICTVILQRAPLSNDRSRRHLFHDTTFGVRSTLVLEKIGFEQCFHRYGVIHIPCKLRCTAQVGDGVLGACLSFVKQVRRRYDLVRILVPLFGGGRLSGLSHLLSHIIPNS